MYLRFITGACRSAFNFWNFCSGFVFVGVVGGGSWCEEWRDLTAALDAEVDAALALQGEGGSDGEDDDADDDADVDDDDDDDDEVVDAEAAEFEIAWLFARFQPDWSTAKQE